MKKKLILEELDLPSVGISDIIIDSINKKWDNIRDLNSMVVTMQEEEYNDMVPVIEGIIAEENNHIGQLEQLVQLLSPSGDEVEVGKQEVVSILDTPIDEGLRNKRNRKRISKTLEEDIMSDYWYVSHYQEHPSHNTIDDYDYATCEMIESEEFTSYDDALEFMNSISEEAVNDYGFERVNDDILLKRSRYIGDDEFIIIEDEQGSEIKEEQIYQ